MKSVFEDRVWLTWLVKVRILILTVLLGIELAIEQFTPVGFPTFCWSAFSFISPEAWIAP